MKLYKTTSNTDAVGPNGKYIQKRAYDASADAASKRRTALKQEDRNSKPESDTIEVPTDKVGLLAWLNTNAT
jgi:hypothetical protein